MAIREIQKGEIGCDDCGKQVATIRTSKQIMDLHVAEAGFTSIRCMDCSEKPAE
jgi:DNA-directed RNA polymerase subunit RPC12/RpoP